MSRTIPAALLSHIAGQTTSLCVCVKLTRLDSSVLGLTTLDRDLVLGGVTYEAMDGIEASAVRASLATGVDNLDVVGVLSSARITDTDLLAGRYDNAAIELFMVNYQQSPITDRVILLTGTLGEVRFHEGSFTAEVRSLSQRLTQQIGELTAATCRVRALGDSRCKVNLASFQFTRTVANTTSPTVIAFAGDTQASGYYTYGRVLFNTGLNAGIQREVKTHSLVNSTAASFTAASSQYLSIADNAALSMGTGVLMTVAGWFYLTTKPGGGASGLAVKQSAYRLYWSGGSDRLTFDVFGTGSAVLSANTFGSPPAANWLFLAGVYDGAFVHIYVNGGNRDSAAYTGGVADDASAFEIGRITGTFADMRASNVGLWKRALTPSEISALYNGGFGRQFADLTTAQKTSLVAWWPLTELSGSRADLVGTNTLTSNNSVGSAAGVGGGQAQLTLQEAFPFAVAVGDQAMLEAGCDRRLATCISRFSNSVNFHGEPFVPGNDALGRRGRR